MASIAACVLFLFPAGLRAAQLAMPEGPAAERGWIVVVHSMRDNVCSGRETNDLDEEYSVRWFEPFPGHRITVVTSLRHLIGAEPDQWQVVASRVYRDVHVWTDLFFLDPPPESFSDERAAELMIAYNSFVFGEYSYVLFCPPRADLEWEGEHSTEPITNGACRANGTLTIRVDDRVPTVIPGDLIRVEHNTGKILVVRGPKAE